LEAPATIEIRAERIEQLFDTLDPTPYPKKDLAASTDEFIFSWARELSRSRPLRIIVHLPGQEAASDVAVQLGEAFSSYFRNRADRLDLDKRELFRIGRWSLLIGMAVLTVCMLLSRAVAHLFGSGGVAQIFQDGLVIFGWVANWRPSEIFLYEWWPLIRQRELYRHLSAARVEVRRFGED
jgi:hypothetical protein